MNDFRFINFTGKEQLKTRQTGAALIIGLVLLMSLTIIGIGAMSTTTLEQRMAGNMGDLYLAFNAAETAGRDIETQLGALPGGVEPVEEPDCVLGQPCINPDLADNWWNSANKTFWTSTARPYSGTIQGVKSQPYSIVEIAAEHDDSVVRGKNRRTKSRIIYYRVTTRGTGISDNAEAVIQQTIARRYDGIR